MRAHAALRDLTVRRLALRRDEAAASLGISVSTFSAWVLQDRMPAGVRIDGITLWDAGEIQDAWARLRDAARAPAEDDDQPFDRVTA